MTTQTKICLFVSSNTGTHDQHQMGIEISPDGGTTWFELPDIVRGVGMITVDHIATTARAKVVSIEGGTSTVDATILVG